jgi:RsiW-degrading membrane proteinase PrsW (M82 family)
MRLLGGLILAAFFGGAFARLLAGSPPMVVVAAAVPAVCWSAAVTLLIPRDRRRWAFLLLALAAGAVVAAFTASYLNTLALGLTTRALGDETARWLTPSILAPINEEMAKAAVLALWMLMLPSGVGGILEGLVLGALVGIGFAFTENVEYFTIAAVQGGETGLLQSAYVRGVLGGLAHAAFCAATGAGLGLARQRRDGGWRAAGIVGFSLATLSHLFWNVVVGPGITETLCNAPRPGAPCQPNPAPLDLWVRAPGIALLGLAPALFVLAMFFLLARRHPNRIG